MYCKYNVYQIFVKLLNVTVIIVVTTFCETKSFVSCYPEHVECLSRWKIMDFSPRTLIDTYRDARANRRSRKRENKRILKGLTVSSSFLVLLPCTIQFSKLLTLYPQQT